MASAVAGLTSEEEDQLVNFDDFNFDGVMAESDADADEDEMNDLINLSLADARSADKSLDERGLMLQMNIRKGECFPSRFNERTLEKMKEFQSETAPTTKQASRESSSTPRSSAVRRRGAPSARPSSTPRPASTSSARGTSWPATPPPSFAWRPTSPTAATAPSGRGWSAWGCPPRTWRRSSRTRTPS